MLSSPFWPVYELCCAILAQYVYNEPVLRNRHQTLTIYVYGFVIRDKHYSFYGCAVPGTAELSCLTPPLCFRL